MQKNFTKLIAHFLSTKRYTVPAGALLLFLATSLYVWANIITIIPQELSISADKAVGGRFAGYTVLNSIVLEEQSNDDFKTGNGTLTLRAPEGWRFKPAGVNLVITNPGGNNSNVDVADTTAFGYTANTITIPLNVKGVNRLDKLEIRGVGIQPLSGEQLLPARPVTLSLVGTTIVGFSSPTTVANIALTHGSPWKLAYEVQPSNTEIYTAIPTAPTVLIQDYFGHTVTTAVQRVSLRISDNPHGNGNIVGSFSELAQNGIVTFNNVQFNAAGAGYTLEAYNLNYIPTTSNSFTVTSKVPTLNSISSTICIIEGASDYELTVSGVNFDRNAVGRVNGVARPTNWVNSTQLTISIPAEDLATAGDKTIDVLNPGPPTEYDSNDQTLVVRPAFSNIEITPNDEAVCAGEEVVYSVQTTGFTNYRWVVSEGASVVRTSGSSATVLFSSTPPTSGTVTVTAYATVCGIEGSNSFNVTVNPSPTVTLSGLEPVCVSAPEIILSGGSPAGGTYTGPGVNSEEGVFNPAVAGVGTHIIMYSYSIGDCSNVASTSITVTATPVATLGDFEPICLSDGLITLSGGLPAGGIYSGNGVVDGVLDPAVAGVGSHDITYTVIQNGCSASQTKSLTVNSTPNVTFEVQSPVCLNAPAFALSGGRVDGETPTTGTESYSGPGVSNGMFNPSVAGEGSHNIIYTYTSPSGCSSFISQTIVVQPLPDVTLDPFDKVCINDAPFTLVGGIPGEGSFSGNGVVEGVFYPEEAGIGSHTITYSYTSEGSNGCNNTASQDIEVTAAPVATLAAFDPVCFNTGLVTLSGGLPVGGTYSGTGVQNGQFNSSVAGVGIHEIIYEITIGGCTSSATQTIEVNPVATASITSSTTTTFCAGGSVQLNAVANPATPAGGGEYTYQWYNQQGPIAGATGVSYTASATDNYSVVIIHPQGGCPSVQAAPVSVTVNNLPTAPSTTPAARCGAGQLTLSASGVPANGSYRWYIDATEGTAIAGATGSTYSPTVSATTTYYVSTVSAAGCESVARTAVTATVNTVPTASISTTTATTVCSGSVLLTAVANPVAPASGNYSYQWRNGSTNIPGATGSTYNATTSGNYTVVIINPVSSGSCASTPSTAVQVTVNPTITGNTIAGAQTVCSGGTIAPLTQATTATLAGGATPYVYQWQVSTNNSTWSDIATGGNAASYIPPVQTVTTATTTYYKRIVSGGSCSSTSASVAVTVTPLPTLSFTGTLASTSVFYTGQSAVALTASPAGGTFSGPGVSGNVTAGYTFNPCTAGAGSRTITYTYKSTTGAQCSNTITKEVTVNQSTYKAVVTSSLKPFCQGDNVTHTVKVYRDVEVIYPYLTNAAGDPVRDLTTMTPVGPQEQPVANPAYPFPANTPQIIKDFAWRYFNPIVNIGTGQEITSGISYQWTKNQEPEIGADGKTFSNAGLSSLDYYAAYVTVGGGACGPNFTTRISSRTYTAEQANYNITLSANPNPVCQGAAVTFTAALSSNFPWSTSNLVLNWMVNGVVIGTTDYTAQGADALTFTTTGPAGGFKDGDEVSIDFNTDIEKFDKVSKCRNRSNSSVIVMQVNDIIAVVDPVDQSTTVCLGGGATFNAPVTTTGPAVVNYVWTVGGTTYPASTSSSLTVGSDITAVAGVYPVSVVVSNTCDETTPSLAIGNLTVRDLASYTVSGGGSYCTNVPESFPINLSGSETGVNYTLWRGTDLVQTLAGTGSALEFTTQSIAGNYTVQAAYATGIQCAEEMAGSATVTANAPSSQFGDLKVTWINNMTQWEVVASQYSESYGANPTFTWYTRSTGQTDEQWVRVTPANNTNILIVNNPAEDLEIKAEVLTTDATCQAFVLTNIGVTILPVEIIYLNASKQGNEVLLEWATAMEQGNAGFEVQVSTDGFTYRKLTFVAAKNGNASTRQEYAFTDKENGKFGTRYYRLKQLDTNGTHEYFGPKAVSFGSVASKVIAFPNPFHDEVTLDIASETADEALVTVTDAVGKQLLVRKVQVEKGFTTEKLRLDASLPRGLYIIKAQVGGVTQYIKMIKE